MALVLKRLKQIGTGIKSLPKAAEVFGESLASGVREELAKPGSGGNRFMDAPLGQYYLPSKVQTALGFVAPSPRKVIRDTRNVVRNPSAGNIAAAGGNALSIATLPLAGAAGLRAGRGAIATVKGARAASAARAAVAIPKGPLRSSSVELDDMIGALSKARQSGARMSLDDQISMMQRVSSSIGKPAVSAAHTAPKQSLLPRSLPKGLRRGEGGWIRATQGEHGVMLRFGKGKFPGEANLARDTIGKTRVSDPGAGFYRATLTKGTSPEAVNVDYFKRIGNIGLEDVGRELTAVQRALQARGISQIEASAASPSRKRLFDALLARQGAKGKISTVETLTQRPKVAARQPGLSGKAGKIIKRLHTDETGAIGPRRLKELGATDEMVSPAAWMTPEGKFIEAEPTHGQTLARIYKQSLREPKTLHKRWDSAIKRGWVRIHRGEGYAAIETWDTKGLRAVGKKLPKDLSDSARVYLDLNKEAAVASSRKTLTFGTEELLGKLYPKTVGDLRRLARPSRLGGKKAPRTKFLDLWERVAKRERGE